MKSLVSFLAVYGASLCYAQTTNFFLSPGSQQEQLDSGNNTDGYPVYARNDKFTFTWMTNWTRVSLILYQNENASALRLFENENNPPSEYTYDMNPDVNLTWNDVFFATLWNENRASEGGIPYFSSSYFRINASSSTTTTSTQTPSSTPVANNTDTTPDSQSTSPSLSGNDGGSGLDTGAKVGIGVGVGLGVPALALAGLAAFYFRRRAKIQAQQLQMQQAQQYQPGTGAVGQYGGHPSQPVSELSSPAPYKPPTNAQYRAPSEVETSNVGAGVQSRFQELSGN
ncbi:hypothetical protein BDW60DRAFT_60426 [Aspergillus nidulans var. acristatus]